MEPPPYRLESVQRRFTEQRRITPTGCWIWLGPQNKSGYGRTFTAHNRYWLTHRLAYTVFIGPIPDGDQVLHRCDTPLCFNPEHLWSGTQSDNTRDAAVKGRARGGRPTTMTADSVRELRRLAREGVRNADLARRYGITSASVYDIKTYKSWKYTDDPTWSRADLTPRNEANT